MIEKRLSGISCNQEEFNRAKLAYAQAIDKTGYKQKLQFQTENSFAEKDTENGTLLEKSGYKQKLQFQTENSSRKRHRKRNITWFNPLFSNNVSTNIGRKFLNLLDKHFTSNHKLHPICNRNCIKVSYGCMPNMAAIIKLHNSNMTNPPKIDKTKLAKTATVKTNPTAR